MFKLISQNMGSSPFDCFDSLMYAKLRIHFKKEMYVIGHYLHLQKFNLQVITDILDEFLETSLYITNQNFASVFRAPDDMILAAVHHIVITFVFHDSIISQYAI